MINSLILLLSLLNFQPDYELELISYFLNNQTQEHHILDRASNRQLVSVSATGLGYLAFCRAVERKIISRADAILWIRTSVEETNQANLSNGGYFWHWTINNKPALNNEVSSLDSVIYLISLERAAKRLNDDGLKQTAWRMKQNVDLKIMLNQDGFFGHGFFNPTGELANVRMIPYFYKNLDESVIMYKFFNLPFHPQKSAFDLPLFTFFYPLAFYEDKFLYDNLGKAIKFQLDNNKLFGFTACDGPRGYVISQPGLISPLAVFSCRRFYPRESDLVLKKLNVSPTTSSMFVDHSWISKDRIGIDMGIALELIGNKQ